jgi:reactive intermediate/imine deaminase
MIRILALGLAFVVSAATAASADVQYFANPKPPGPFSDAVRVDNMLILSGQIGLTPAGELPKGFEDQSRQTMENIVRTLKDRGLTMDDVVKCTVMLTDMAKWPAFNKIYATYFKPDRLPARSAFGATALALGAEMEVECWAYMPAAKGR